MTSVVVTYLIFDTFYIKETPKTIKRSKIVEILLEVLEAHFVLEHFGVLKAVLNFIQSNVFPKGFEHLYDIIGREITLSKL